MYSQLVAFFFYYSMNKSKSQTPLKLCWDPARWKWYVYKSYIKSSFQMEFPSCQFWICSKEFPLRNHLGDVKFTLGKLLERMLVNVKVWFRMDSVHIHRYFMTAFGISNNNASSQSVRSFLRSRDHQNLITPKEYISKWCFYCKVIPNNL